VAFAVSEPLRADVAAAGFDGHYPVGAAWTMADLPMRFPELGAIPPGPARYEYARAHVFAAALPLDVVDDLTRVIERWRPDVVVRESAEFGGYLAAERAGLPHVMVRTDSGSALYSERHVVADSLDAVRARIGLPPDPGAERPFDHLQLSAGPPVMDGPAAERPVTWHHVRPTVEPSGDVSRASERSSTDKPAWLDGLGARGPVVYATLGTVYSAPDLLAAIIAAVASERVEVVVTTGPVDPAALGPQPDHVHLARWIAQADLLGRCDAVVTHGGFGTLAACLTHGVPLVMLPISADQPMNARRAADAGVGIELAPTERTVGDIGAAVDAVLTDPRYAIAAIAAAAGARAQPPLDHGLDLIEALVAQPAFS
jgi:UDP:flavonoid glycosyltransferase YjiC (YdhE family)